MPVIENLKNHKSENIYIHATELLIYKNEDKVRS